MGMFDNVDVGRDLPCPQCLHPLPRDAWQSKDGPCTLAFLEPAEVDNFYVGCRLCGTWIEYTRLRPSRSPAFDPEEWEIHVEPKALQA
jgi:hypothetical protein